MILEIFTALGIAAMAFGIFMGVIRICEKLQDRRVAKAERMRITLDRAVLTILTPNEVRSIESHKHHFKRTATYNTYYRFSCGCGYSEAISIDSFWGRPKTLEELCREGIEAMKSYDGR